MHKALHSFIIINKQTSFPLAWPAQGNRNHLTGFTSVSCAEHPQLTSSNPAVNHCKAAGEHSSLHQTFCSESLVQPSEGSSTPRTPAAGTELSCPKPSHPSQHISASPWAAQGQACSSPITGCETGECWQWESCTPTCPRNAQDQYCSPLVQHPNRCLGLHSKGALKWLGSTAEPREQQQLKLKPACPKWLKHQLIYTCSGWISAKPA